MNGKERHRYSKNFLFASDAFSGRATPIDETEGAVNYAKSIGADLKVLGHLQDRQPVTSIKLLRKVSVRILIIAGGDDHGYAVLLR